MRPSGTGSSSQSFRPKCISERFLIRLPGLRHLHQLVSLERQRLTSRGWQTANMFGSPWASENGLKASQQYCKQPRPHLGFIYPQKKMGHASPQHLNIQTLQTWFLGCAESELLTQEGAQNQQPAEFKTM